MEQLPYQKEYEPKYEHWLAQDSWTIFEGVFLILGYDPDRVKRFWEMANKTKYRKVRTSPIRQTIEIICDIHKERPEIITLDHDLSNTYIPSYVNLFEILISSSILTGRLKATPPSNDKLYETKVKHIDLIQLCLDFGIPISTSLAARCKSVFYSTWPSLSVA